MALHGQTDWNCQGRYQGQIDISLNAHGRKQARILAKKLQPIKPAAIWASDLRRARETAVILAAPLKLRVLVHPGLRELDFGSWQGLTWLQIAERFPDAWCRWTENPLGCTIPGGERIEKMEERFRRALVEICGQYPGQDVFVIAHGGPIGRLLLELRGGEFWEMLQGNCAYSVLEYSQGRFAYQESGKQNARIPRNGRPALCKEPAYVDSVFPL